MRKREREKVDRGMREKWKGSREGKEIKKKKGKEKKDRKAKERERQKEGRRERGEGRKSTIRDTILEKIFSVLTDERERDETRERQKDK
jgi:hypothetical protein